MSRSRYFAALGAVEIGSRLRPPPRLPTAEGWRKESPAGFEFALCAAPELTRGHFRALPQVELAWDATRAVARALGARFLVFETPASFFPDADHLRDMYHFFKSLGRGGPGLVWQPRGSWSERMKSRVCADLGLILAEGAEALGPCRGAEPGLAAGASPGRPAPAINYFRLGGTAPFGDGQLERLRRLCQSRPSYVFFLNLQAWGDAQRFLGGPPSSHVRNLRRL